MPRSLAIELCELDVKVPYKAIAAAARQGLEGAEVWIIAQSALGLAGDIPPMMKSLFTDNCYWMKCKDIGQIDEADLLDLLYLSINSSIKVMHGIRCAC
ncbi:hypothetical protein OEZ86_005277 [Tetradesmus obliquus]|nr:hypothetical protein OEZ86_005277 [Tetradesmus obliquus]